MNNTISHLMAAAGTGLLDVEGIGMRSDVVLLRSAAEQMGPVALGRAMPRLSLSARLAGPPYVPPYLSTR